MHSCYYHVTAACLWIWHNILFNASEEKTFLRLKVLLISTTEKNIYIVLFLISVLEGNFPNIFKSTASSPPTALSNVLDMAVNSGRLTGVLCQHLWMRS